MPNVKVRLTDTLLDRQLDMYADRQLWLKITDTLEDKELDYISDNGGYYDKIIGNPPYGAWQDYDKRKILKKKYKGQYVKETYTLFLYRCIFLLKKGGKLSFIIPDTFLFLNMHKSLREFLLKSTKIEEILIFPSNFFPGVNFGYSNLSIITLEKDDCESVKDNDVKIFTGFKTVRELGRIDENSENLQCFCYKQSDILKNENYKFIITDNSKIAIINDSKVRIGDVADVVTGFYSGNNKEFICAKSKEIKGAQNYRMVDCDKIYDCYDLTGIKNVAEGYVSYVKGSSDTRYIRKEDELLRDMLSTSWIEIACHTTETGVEKLRNLIEQKSREYIKKLFGNSFEGWHEKDKRRKQICIRIVGDKDQEEKLSDSEHQTLDYRHLKEKMELIEKKIPTQDVMIKSEIEAATIKNIFRQILIKDYCIREALPQYMICLLYTSDAADD